MIPAHCSRNLTPYLARGMTRATIWATIWATKAPQRKRPVRNLQLDEILCNANLICEGLLDTTEHSNREHVAAQRFACRRFAGPRGAGSHGGGLLQHWFSHRTARPERFRAPVRAHDVSRLGQRRQ